MLTNLFQFYFTQWAFLKIVINFYFIMKHYEIKKITTEICTLFLRVIVKDYS